LQVFSFIKHFPMSTLSNTDDSGQLCLTPWLIILDSWDILAFEKRQKFITSATIS